MIQTWRLDTPSQTLILASANGAMAEVVYWGQKLPADEDLSQVYAVQRIDVTGGMLDDNPPVSICPEAIRSFPGQTGLIATSNSGVQLTPTFVLHEAEEQQDLLRLVYEDSHLQLRYTATFELHCPTEVIEASATLESAEPVHVHWLAAPVVPGSQASTQMLDFAGRWCGEMQTLRSPWQPGIRLRESRSGRSGHENFPGLLTLEAGTTNTQGRAYGFHYGWSGGHRMVCETLADGRRQIQFGHAMHTELAAVRVFSTATLYLTHSTDGINGIARAFQRHVRQRVIPATPTHTPRPVHYNCWEAIYFDHKLDDLKAIASRAAELGAERFVLDDGWFGRRDNDTHGLGDWWIDKRKYPDGLTPLIDHVHSVGMQFGIWLEPEMISPDSDTYRAHPDWALGPRDQTLGRQQMVLDMANPNVQAYLYDAICELLAHNAIGYVKWDHNRVLPLPDAAQTRGTYALFAKLRQSFPQVEFESCASGGGRLDYGILAHTQRVWLSDSNDALERARIQHAAAIFLPASVTGSHVGASVSHTSGRVHDISFRAWVAAQRHMGFEMDPRALTADEAQTLSHITRWWKTQRDWLMSADILRLESNDPAVLIEQHLSEDGEQFLVFVNRLDTSTQILPQMLAMTALEADARYRLELVNRDELGALSRGNPLLKHDGGEFSGQYLMAQGLSLPWSFPGRCLVLKGLRLR
ncbi:MAG: alpha-galactosidase [Gammaproteobacteria bacterium]|nr:alpha-galactosidase [Gammaproteobacteria bacterium]